MTNVVQAPEIVPNLLCFDPGVSTGWCYLQVRNGTAHLRACGIATGYYELMWLFLHLPEKCMVVMEEFHTTGRCSPPMEVTLQRIGAIELLCLIHQCAIVSQLPQSRKAYLYTASQILEDWTFPVHVQDALAHGLRYVYRCWGIKKWETPSELAVGLRKQDYTQELPLLHRPTKGAS